MLLEVEDLKVHFSTPQGTVRAVDGVSFSLDAGRTLGLVGESGSGKSVTALSLLRLLPEPPARIVSGAVRFEGADLVKLPGEALRRVRGGRIGFVFQDPMTFLNPVYRVGRQIAEVLEAHAPPASAADRRARVVELLGQVGIPDPASRYDAYPHELSGGLRQRVMIAMALANRPALLVADEPTTALDVTIQAQILELLAKLKRELAMSVLLITHDLGIVRGFADEVVVMYAGQVVERASARELFASPRHPYTKALLGSIPSLRAPLAVAGRRPRLPGIEGTVPSPLAYPTGCRFQDRCPLVTARCRATDPALEKKSDGRLARCHEVS